jgi:F0F1-type ATP synthase membrane subunit b/b'
MFIPLEIILILLTSLFLVRFVLIPAIRPLLGKRWEDKQLEEAQDKHRQAQKLLKAAELHKAALEAEVKADEIIDKALEDKLK